MVSFECIGGRVGGRKREGLNISFVDGDNGKAEVWGAEYDHSEATDANTPSDVLTAGEKEKAIR